MGDSFLNRLFGMDGTPWQEDALRAELQNAERQIDRLKAENADNRGFREFYKQQLIEKSVQCDRYREALEEAKSLALSNSKSWIGTTNGFLKIARLAHTALKGEDG